MLHDLFFTGQAQHIPLHTLLVGAKLGSVLNFFEFSGVCGLEALLRRQKGHTPNRVLLRFQNGFDFMCVFGGPPFLPLHRFPTED